MLPDSTQRYPHLRRYLLGAVWSPSYFARTIGEGVTAETVLKYIETHDEHAAEAPGLGPGSRHCVPIGLRDQADHRSYRYQGTTPVISRRFSAQADSA
jgi:hypothetical protein